MRIKFDWKKERTLKRPTSAAIGLSVLVIVDRSWRKRGKNLLKAGHAGMIAYPSERGFWRFDLYKGE